MLTTASEWNMPAPPAPDCVPVAHLVGSSDGWSLFWAVRGEEDSGDYWSPKGSSNPVEIPWPFGNDDFATRPDMERVGFHVTE